MLIIMMMMMPRKTMAHIKTNPATPTTDATHALTHDYFVQEPIKFLLMKLPIHSKIRNAWNLAFSLF